MVAQTWMGCWDVSSEILTDSGSAYISEWWKTLCARLGIHHLRCEVHQHRALPAERAGKTIINMLRKELASDKDVHWLEILFALLRRYHNTELYREYSPNQLVFGRNKCWWNLPYNRPRECKDASAFFDEIQAGEKEAKRLIEKFQADWLSIANQGTKEPQDLEKADRVWLRQSETTQKGDSKLLPLWEDPFEIVSRVRENSFKVRVDVNRELKVSGDRLKPEIPSPKGRVKPLFWTSKWLSECRIEGGNYEVERLVDHYRDDEGNWRFLVKYKGFPESENTWEPPSSFVHGYTTGFRNHLRAHPEIPVLFTDCLSKADRVVEKDGAKAVVVDGDPAPPPQIPAHSARNPRLKVPCDGKHHAPLPHIYRRAMRGVRCVNENHQTRSVVAASLQRCARWLFVHILRHSELIFVHYSLTSVSSKSDPNFKFRVHQAQLRPLWVDCGATQYTWCVVVSRQVFAYFSGSILRCYW